jgi:hypothetical protein
VRKVQWGITCLVIFVMARTATFLAGVPTEAPSPAAREARGRVFVRAQVFVPDPPDIASLDLTRHPTDDRPFAADAPITCRYVPEPVSGTTPKFTCRLVDSGETIKVKYGRTPEIPAEVGATRFLAALGFATDRVSLVDTLHCLGCPPSPFRLRQIADTLLLSPLFERSLQWDVAHTFRRVAVERKFPGTPVEVESIEGWDFTELVSVDSRAGGADRADVDALRLVAVLLAHWDNKAANQRLVCLDRLAEESSTECGRPLLMLQDLGATFGPSKTNLARWSSVPVWDDPASCRVSMSTLPYQGATFKPAVISEGGRARLAERLRQLTRHQMRQLFETSGFPAEDGVEAWVNALEQKIRAIVDRPSCPSGA